MLPTANTKTDNNPPSYSELLENQKTESEISRITPLDHTHPQSIRLHFFMEGIKTANEKITKVNKNLQTAKTNNSEKAEIKKLKKDLEHAIKEQNDATDQCLKYAQGLIDTLNTSAPLQTKIENIQALHEFTRNVENIEVDKLDVHLSRNGKKKSIKPYSFSEHFLSSFTVREIGKTISAINSALESENLKELCAQ